MEEVCEYGWTTGYLDHIPINLYLRGEDARISFVQSSNIDRSVYDYLVREIKLLMSLREIIITDICRL